MQQSVAFKILRTRLKTVPPYSFSGEQFKRLSPGKAFTEANHVGGSQIAEDGDGDTRNGHNGINFSSLLKDFVRVQEQHRAHSKMQSQVRCSSSSSKDIQRPEEANGALAVPDTNKHPSRTSSRRSPGQLQL